MTPRDIRPILAFDSTAPGRSERTGIPLGWVVLACHSSLSLMRFCDSGYRPRVRVRFNGVHELPRGVV